MVINNIPTPIIMFLKYFINQFRSSFRQFEIQEGLFMVKLILNTPDVFAGGSSVEKILNLAPSDYQGKTVRQIFTEFAFSEALVGQNPVAAEQALQLVFTLIQPKGVIDSSTWWEKPFESLITESEDVTIDVELSEDGLEFINNLM